MRSGQVRHSCNPSPIYSSQPTHHSRQPIHIKSSVTVFIPFRWVFPKPPSSKCRQSPVTKGVTHNSPHEPLGEKTPSNRMFLQLSRTYAAPVSARQSPLTTAPNQQTGPPAGNGYRENRGAGVHCRAAQNAGQRSGSHSLRHGESSSDLPNAWASSRVANSRPQKREIRASTSSRCSACTFSPTASICASRRVLPVVHLSVGIADVSVAMAEPLGVSGSMRNHGDQGIVAPLLGARRRTI